MHAESAIITILKIDLEVIRLGRAGSPRPRTMRQVQTNQDEVTVELLKLNNKPQTLTALVVVSEITHLNHSMDFICFTETKLKLNQRFPTIRYESVP